MQSEFKIWLFNEFSILKRHLNFDDVIEISVPYWKPVKDITVTKRRAKIRVKFMVPGAQWVVLRKVGHIEKNKSLEIFLKVYFFFLIFLHFLALLHFLNSYKSLK